MDGSCRVEPIHKTPTDEEKRHSKAAVFLVFGMGCTSCAARVRNSLMRLKGVLDASADYEKSLARVVFNPNLVAVSELLGAVEGAGGDNVHTYQAEVLEIKGIP